MKISNIFYSAFSEFKGKRTCEVSLFVGWHWHKLFLIWDDDGKFYHADVKCDDVETWDYWNNEVDRFDLDYPNIFICAKQMYEICV